MHMIWQVLELQVMSDMHRCCFMLWSGFVSGASAVAVGLWLAWLSLFMDVERK